MYTVNIDDGIDEHEDLEESLECDRLPETEQKYNSTTVVPTKSDSDVMLCLQLLSKTLT